MFFWLSSLIEALFKSADSVQRRREEEKAARIAEFEKALRAELEAAEAAKKRP